EPAWSSGRSGTSSAANWQAAAEWVCTTAPTSGRAAMISVWIGYSMCRGPLPASTSPSGETRTTRLASTSSKPQPEAFIQTPRPSGSRTLGCPHTMSAWPAAARARQPSTASASARAESKGAYCAASSVMCHLYRYGFTRPQGRPRNAARRARPSRLSAVRPPPRDQVSVFGAEFDPDLAHQVHRVLRGEGLRVRRVGDQVVHVLPPLPGPPVGDGALHHGSSDRGDTSTHNLPLITGQRN